MWVGFGLFWAHLLGELDAEYLCFSFHKQFRTYIDYKHIWLFHAREKNTEKKGKIQETEDNESFDS